MMMQLIAGSLIALLTFPSVPALLQTPPTSFHGLTSTALESSSTSSNFQKKDSSSSEGESEAARLLRLARKLRQQAEEEEQQVHTKLYKKKRAEDEQLDQWIQNLSLSKAVEQKKNTHVLKALQERKPCMDTLERIVDRLHEHHMIASGHERVEAKDVEVQRIIHEKDDAKIEQIELQAEAFFEAIGAIDEDLFYQHHNSDESHKVLTESRHWGGDERAKQLRTRWQGLQREHEEQFLKRQASFFEAQRLKKENPAPPKVKDDHRWLP
ncbi:MAG: hypothetical protein SGBAC_009509 [Bacillariaceae sp.]